MSRVATAPSGASHDLAARWQGFARWWLSGLAEVVPAGWLRWAEREAPPRLIIWRELQTVVCRLTSVVGAVDGHLPFAGFDAAALANWLAEKGLSRDEV